MKPPRFCLAVEIFVPLVFGVIVVIILLDWRDDSRNTESMRERLAEARLRSKRRAEAAMPRPPSPEMMAELDRIKLEGNDEAARRRFDAQMEEILDRWSKKELQQSDAGKPRPRFELHASTWIAALLLGLGFALEVIVGKQFVVPYHDRLSDSMLVAVTLSLPLFGWLYVRMMRQERIAQLNSLLKRVLMFPFAVLFIAFFFYICPFGWLAGAGWVLGTPTATAGTIVALDEKEAHKDCSRFATIETSYGARPLCVDGTFHGVKLEPGRRVRVVGKASRLGLYVQEVHEER